MYHKGIFLLNNDLRVSANPGLELAVSACTHLHVCYVLHRGFLGSNPLSLGAIGRHRLRFLLESLQDLRTQLKGVGLQLFVYSGDQDVVLRQLIRETSCTRLYVGESEDPRYRQWVDCLPCGFAGQFKLIKLNTRTLYDESQLPFAVQDLPSTFSQFKRKIDHLEVHKPKQSGFSSIPVQRAYPSLAAAQLDIDDELQLLGANSVESHFIGGETAGEQHLDKYFSSDAPKHYKETRNALDGWNKSSKFSPWLAHGCLSPRTLWHALKSYESRHGSNKSTQWIAFELLWREYFHWYSSKHGLDIFAFSGIKKSDPTATFNAYRFGLWCRGQTPYPIVNACMHQLNEIGYMSNRGRQIVASCFVHELGQDWRYGAQYFGRELIDYDVASNWGNWQYLAGVGADPRGWRHFNLEKQTQTHDPQESFIDHWRGKELLLPLDNVDMVDWPL